MIKHIIALFAFSILYDSILISADNKYDKFDNIRQDQLGKYSVIVKQGDKYGVIDLFGNEILNLEYSSIEFLKENMFRVTKDTLYGYVDMEGKTILPIEYSISQKIKYRQTQDYLKDDFYLIYKNGKYGVFDQKRKKIIIPAEYKWIVGKDYAANVVNTSKLKDESETLPFISALLQNDQEESLVDLRTGKTIIDFGIYDSMNPSDKYGYIVVSKDGKNAIIDYDNNIIVPFQDESLSIGKFGFLSYSKSDHKFQFISNKNNEKSKKYDSISMYFNGLSQVESNGKKGIINEFGKEILPLNYDHFYITDDYIEAIVEGKSASKPPKITFFDIEGKPRSKSLSYSGAVYNVNSGLIVVSDFDDKEGLLNQQGKLVMPLQYRRIYIDEEANIIRFEVDNDDVKMGLADMQGKIIVKPKYNRIDEFIDGVANITISEENRSLHGLINIKGEEILKPQFTSMLFDMDDKEKYAQVYNNRMVGVVSRDGRVTVPPKFDEIVYQNKQGDDWGDLAITKLDKKYGIVNINTGKIIAEPIYDYAFSIGKGDSILFCLRSTEEGNYIIDKNGDLVIPITKDVIYPLQYMENNNYFIRKQKDGKKGIISRNNENLIPCIYDNITQLNFDLFKVELDGKIGIVDNKNNPIFPIEFDYLYPRTTLLFAKKGNEYGYIFLDKKVFEPSPIAKQLYEYITRK